MPSSRLILRLIFLSLCQPPPGLKSVPQFTLEIEAEDIPLVIGHEQLRGLFHIQRGFERQRQRMAQRQRLYQR